MQKPMTVVAYTTDSPTPPWTSSQTPFHEVGGCATSAHPATASDLVLTGGARVSTSRSTAYDSGVPAAATPPALSPTFGTTWPTHCTGPPATWSIAQDFRSCTTGQHFPTSTSTFNTRIIAVTGVIGYFLNVFVQFHLRTDPSTGKNTNQNGLLLERLMWTSVYCTKGSLHPTACSTERKGVHLF